MQTLHGIDGKPFLASVNPDKSVHNCCSFLVWPEYIHKDRGSI